LQGLRVGGAPPEHFGMTADDHQQIVEIVRDAAGELSDCLHLVDLCEVFARAFERALGLLAIGDVEADPMHAHYAALFVLEHLDAGLDIPDLAIRPHDAPLGAKTLARCDRARDLVANPLAVVRMDTLQVALKGASKLLAWLDSKYLVQLLRPGDLVLLEIADPAAEIGEALRVLQERTLLSKLAFDAPAVLHLALQGSIH